MSLPLLSAIIALLAWSAYARDRDRTVVAAALLANLLACWGVFALTGEGFDPLALFAFDFTAAVLIVVATDTRPPLAVAAIYLIECIAHAAVSAMMAARWGIDQQLYAEGLKALAWAQVLYVGGWGGYIAYRRNLDPDHPVDDAQPRGAAATPLARSEDGS